MNLKNDNNDEQENFSDSVDLRSIYKRIRNNKKLRKFYQHRYTLFTRFDDGILLDKESWYSVTPEKVAKHIAERCYASLMHKNGEKRSLLVLDAFCGAGGNVIQFAQTFDLVTACDIDMVKLEYTRHNAKIYKCEKNIELICDSYENVFNAFIESNLKPDMIFMSPPWGGVSYQHSQEIDLVNEMPIDNYKLFEHASKITKNIAIFLPRNSNLKQVAFMAGLGGSVEVEQNYLDGHLVAITAYYGDLVNMDLINNNDENISE